MHKLRQFLLSRNLTQRQFADKLDPPVTQGLVSQWISGRTTPSLNYANQIQQLTEGRITAADWTEDSHA